MLVKGKCEERVPQDIAKRAESRSEVGTTGRQTELGVDIVIHWIRNLVAGGLVVAYCAAIVVPQWQSGSETSPPDRTEVIFWHFWGGRDRAVVDDVVRRFNQSQSRYWVRGVAVPGNNFDAKLFLSVVGGHPPDLVNQDDPVLADWSALGVVQPVEEYAGPQGVQELDQFLLPAAQRLARVEGRWIAVTNALDIRALYYNATLLDELDLAQPSTLDEFDRAIRRISPAEDPSRHGVVAFLPDPRRVWTWGYVFGGQFIDRRSGNIVPDSPPIVRALEWMAEFSRRYGVDFVARYRQSEQTLPGKTFPLLPAFDDAMVGRYAFVLDGQWRTRDIEAFAFDRARRGVKAPRFGVCPPPPPEGGRSRSGWVNGNFFLVPRGAKNPAGAWAFMRFWIGLDDPVSAAETCAAGGWVPVSETVIRHPRFQQHMREHPLFSEFVELASSDQLFPFPQVAGAMFAKRTIESAADEAVAHPERSAADLLRQAGQRIQSQLERIRRTRGTER